jgi:DNA-binding transcriptional LysR family regulator
MNTPRISLEQWRALVAVVEAGGYGQAAEQLHKSQSTVTYAIQKLEDLLSVRVFELQGRKAVLTPAGQVLYRRGRSIVEEALRVERAAGSLAAGWEPELRIAVEILFPTWLLLRCLETLSREQPAMRLELFESVLGGTDELLREGQVHLAVGSEVPAGMIGEVIVTLSAIAVASPEHPLHQLGRPVTIDDLRAHRHIVIRDSGSQRSRSVGWTGSEQRWTVSHKATAIRALTMGLGFAWQPEDNIRAELERGQLKALPLVEGAERRVPLYLIYPDRDAAGPGARRLGQLIREATARCPEARPTT